MVAYFTVAFVRKILRWSLPETLVIKVGTEDRPATSEQIQEIQLAFAQVSKDKDLTFVSHHALESQN